MDRLSGLVRPLFIVFLLATPAIIQRVASEFSDNPYLRPLALTQEGLAAANRDLGEGPWIKVRVGWGDGYDGALSREHLRQVIAAPLEHQTDRYVVMFRDIPGDRVDVRFEVGANSYGPYSPGGVVNGLNAALAALRMEQSAWKTKSAFRVQK